MDTLTAMQDALHREADSLLREREVLDLLGRYGTPHVAGSYALGLMTWRDLDLYVETGDISLADFFALGAGLAERLQPERMNFRNERVAETAGLPAGLYWGIYLGDERAGAWKIDVWAVGRAELERLLREQTELARRISPEHREAILQIKHAVWRDPGYRRSFSSQDIYAAVLEHGVRTPERFKSHLQLR